MEGIITQQSGYDGKRFNEFSCPIIECFYLHVYWWKVLYFDGAQIVITTNRQPCKLATGLKVWLEAVSFTLCTLVNTKKYARQSCNGSKILASKLILQSIDKKIIANSRK